MPAPSVLPFQPHPDLDRRLRQWARETPTQALLTRGGLAQASGLITGAVLHWLKDDGLCGEWWFFGERGQLAAREAWAAVLLEDWVLLGAEGVRRPRDLLGQREHLGQPGWLKPQAPPPPAPGPWRHALLERQLATTLQAQLGSARVLLGCTASLVTTRDQPDLFPPA